MKTRLTSKMYRTISLLVSAVCFAVSVALAETVNPATTPVFHPLTANHFEDMRAVAKKGEASLVFLGDDTFGYWTEDENKWHLQRGGLQNWTLTWGSRKAANFGMAGDRTEHVLWRLDHGLMDGLKPKVIVLLIGMNNSVAQGNPVDESKNGDKYQCTPEQTAKGIKAIIERLKTRCPESKILLLGIFPMFSRTYRCTPQGEATNAIIKDFADERTVFYLEPGAKFMMSTGSVNIDLMPDGMHLNEVGYRILGNEIMSKVQELMK